MLASNTNSMCYAGIGSRATPPSVLRFMTAVSLTLAKAGYTLRSGGAEGADEAFEFGSAGWPSQIFVPWPGFARRITIGAQVHVVTESPHYPLALEIAEHHHPAWHHCKPGARKLHARNVMQILGPEVNQPSDFVLCWTADGKASGGTGQALRIAAACGVEVFNLQRPDHAQNVAAKLGVPL